MSDVHLASRQAAAARYKPAKVNLLLIAEAPPCDTDRYFYFEDVPQHDWLFRYVYEGLTGIKPARSEKPTHLAQLRDAGVFLIDLHEANISQPSLSVLKPRVPDLIDRCRAIKPRHIALIKSTVYDAAYEPLKAAGLPVIDERLPFPASGQQVRFLQGFARVLEHAGLALGK